MPFGKSFNVVLESASESENDAFLLQTKTSGCAALLSFPEFALQGVNSQPELVAITFSFA